jgi:Protein of unknown function (DUF1997)
LVTLTVQSFVPIRTNNYHLTKPIITITARQQQQQLHKQKLQPHSLQQLGQTSSQSSNRRRTSSTSFLSSTRSNHNERRKILLSRTGPYFKLDRNSGTIEFGATANLVTRLQQPPPSLQQLKSIDDNESEILNMVDLWLLDENRGLAMSIWDPKLMKDLGNNIYRLQIMTLQFVTITLAPWVDVKMETIMDTTSNKPKFIVQSIDFDPNIQILPGMRINADSLGIIIEVAGILRPGNDGTSVTGAMTFQTSGKLPPPLRLLPDVVLKAASDTINTTIVNFVVQSFQKGAKANYQQFLRHYREKKKIEREFPSKIDMPNI